MASEAYYNHRVRLVSVRDELRKVEFKVAPTFTEGRSVEYTPVTPIHMPGSIQVYKNTASRTFSIGATLVARNVNEASENMFLLQRLRSWTLPHFGRSAKLSRDEEDARKRLDAAAAIERTGELNGDEQAQKNIDLVNQGVQLLGAPPMVLYLYAYSSSANDKRGAGSFLRVNINRVPVVITNLSIAYPNDVDYLPAGDGISDINEESESIPTKMEVTVECVETHSPREYERFSLKDFYNGKLVSF